MNGLDCVLNALGYALFFAGYFFAVCLMVVAYADRRVIPFIIMVIMLGVMTYVALDMIGGWLS